ncbi:MAG: S-layer homology domain-containing protein [Pleurocapsa sp.]
MTNSSPPEPQNPIPERRKRPATGVTFDEMIAIIVAFSTIGAILFWSIGGRSRDFGSNFGLGSSGNLLSSDRTTDTGLGLDDSAIRDSSLGEVESDERELVTRLRQQRSPVAYVPPSQALNLAPTERESYRFDSGARLVPLPGIAIPGLQPNPEQSLDATDEAQTEETVGQVKPQPTAQPTQPAPESSGMPRDITSDDWVYPFVKQMSDRQLVRALTTNQTFEPNKLITRASMATLISRAFDTQAETQGVKQFQDVTNRNEIAADIDKAVRLGFMQGYSENTFRPLENIPRYQVLVTLATGLGLEPSQDAAQILQNLNGSENLPDWAREQVAAAYEAELIVNRPGFAQNSLMPNQPATRAEVAAMIHQALVQTGQLQPLESEYIVRP